MNKSGIHIKKANRGKFTSWAKSHGMGVQEAASHVMANKGNYSPTVVKRANFAKNAAGWHHEDGGRVGYQTGNEVKKQTQPKTDISKLKPSQIMRIQQAGHAAAEKARLEHDKAKYEKMVKEYFPGQEHPGQTKEEYRKNHFTNWTEWENKADQYFNASIAATATGVGSRIPYVGKYLNPLGKLGAISAAGAAVNKAIAQGFNDQEDVAWDELGAKLGIAGMSLYGLGDATYRLRKGDKWYKPKIVDSSKEGLMSTGKPAEKTEANQPPKMTRSQRMKEIYQKNQEKAKREEAMKAGRRASQSRDSKAKYENATNIRKLNEEHVVTVRPQFKQEGLANKRAANWQADLDLFGHENLGLPDPKRVPWQAEFEQAVEAAGHRRGGGVHQLTQRLDKKRNFKINFNR